MSRRGYDSAARFGGRLKVSVLLWSLICLPFASAAVSSPASPNEFPGSKARAEPQQAEASELKVGTPIERELKGGEEHTYGVRLEAGQYLHVVVEQKGIDVVVRLVAPDGKQVIEMDSPNGSLGPEPILAIAEAEGEYRVKVRSLDEKAAPGRYEVRVEEVRAAMAKDRDRVAAERIFTEALQLRLQGTSESLRKAIEKFNQALPLWRTVENKKEEASTLNQIGNIYWQFGESQKSLEYYSQALSLRQALGNRAEEAYSLHNVGTAYWQMGESQKALEYYRRALPLIRAAKDRQQEAGTLSVIGLAYDSLGKPQEALDYHTQALALQRARSDPAAEANTLNNIGVSYHTLGDLPKALESYSQALPLSRAVGNRRLEAYTLSNIGGVYESLGDLQKAIEYHNQALPLRRATGDRSGEYSTLHNLGLAYQSSGDLQKALEYYNQALSLARALGARRGEAYTLNNIGTVYRMLGDSQKALDYLNQTLPLRRAMGDQRGEANTLSQIGVSYSSLGKPEDALNSLRQALVLLRSIGDRDSEAATLRHISRAERDLGHLDEARAHIETALKIIEGTRSKFIDQQLRTLFSASRQDYYELYIDLLMRLHRSQPSAGYEATALQASERARARSLLDILTESRADIRQGVDPALLERERTAQRQLSAAAERLTRLLGGKHTEEQEKAAKQEVETLVSEYQEVEAELRAKSPRYAALTQPQPLSAQEIQQTLDQETILLEYALGEERSYLWMVTQTSIKSFELPKRAEIEAQARRVYEAMTARNITVRFEKQEKRQARIAQADAEYFTASAVLSQTLLGPVADQLGHKQLLIVVEGVLQYVPFGALPIPGGRLTGSDNQGRLAGNFRPLILEHEIVSLPSVSVLAEVRKELTSRGPSAKTVAIFADPVFEDNDQRVKRPQVKADGRVNEPSSNPTETRGLEGELERSARELGGLNFERLPHTRQEAAGILALTPKGTGRESLDFEANRTAATSPDLSNYRVIHFATHALLNSQHPELSGVVLSLVDEEGRPRDGFLRLHEIYNLKLGADLIVLSACRTALGKEVKGEGLVGLTRGFMYAGAPRVIASLWAVEDETTAQLMKRFYREMLIRKQRPAAALRAAQASLWGERRLPPYYWAAFVLQGEWR